MPNVKLIIQFTPKEFRDQVLTKIPVKKRGEETLADIFDLLVKSLVETAGLSEKEAQAFAAPGFLQTLRGFGFFDFEGACPEIERCTAPQRGGELCESNYKACKVWARLQAGHEAMKK